MVQMLLQVFTTVLRCFRASPDRRLGKPEIQDWGCLFVEELFWIG
jgi:hypothetical protein